MRVSTAVCPILVLSLVASGPPARVSAQGADDVRLPVPRVPVTVFNYAGLSPGDLDMVIQTAAGVLGAAGVPSLWRRCTPGTEPALSGCHAPLLPGDLGLRLLRAGPEAAGPAPGVGLGFAVQDRHGAGVLASVYIDRVGRLSRAARMPPTDLAGLIAAHELGHLLLESSRHAEVGIMQSAWVARDLRGRRVVEWRFSAADAAVLREAARRRRRNRFP